MQSMLSFASTGHGLHSRLQSVRAAPATQMMGSPVDLPSSMATSLANAWSVSGDTLNSSDLASSLFAISLFPYLAFLWFLSRPVTKTPEGVLKGFQFLLVFVFATIPAGIFAKVQYHDILANIDWLHGGAESLLTVTNLLIILGFRATRPQPPSPASSDSNGSDGTAGSDEQKENPLVLRDGSSLVGAAMLLISGAVGFFGFHPEPANALSIPTWMVHSSSLLEWLYAMKLVWEHADTSGNEKWRGLTWAMIPSHTSGICACTYHLFYNSPALNWVVTSQAGLTVLGNTALAAAAGQIWYSQKKREDEALITSNSSFEEQKPIINSLSDTDTSFFAEMLVKSLVASVFVKYGELFFDFPFEAKSGVAAAFIALPTLWNINKWATRSKVLQESREGSSAAAAASSIASE